jgi:hypothetical protein
MDGSYRVQKEVDKSFKTLVSNPKRKNTFKTLQRGGRIILKWIRVWIGFIWNRTALSTGSL